MTRVRLVLVAAFGLVMMMTGVAQADDAKITDMASKLKKLYAQKGEALATISLADEQKPPKEKEKKLFDEEKVKLGPPLEALLKKFEAHDADATKVNEKIKAHNASCSGQLSKSNFDRCQGEKAYYAKEKARIDTAADQLKKEQRPLIKRVDAIDDRLKELGKEIPKLDSDRAAAKVNLEKVQKAIDVLEPKFLTECKSAATPVAIKYCNSVNWDNAKKGLEDPELKPKPLTVTPNN